MYLCISFVYLLRQLGPVCFFRVVNGVIFTFYLKNKGDTPRHFAHLPGDGREFPEKFFEKIFKKRLTSARWRDIIKSQSRETKNKAIG